MTEIEVEIEIGVEQEKDIWHQEGMTEDIKAQTLIQGPGIDLLLGSQWTETELDATNVESMTILLMNAQIQSQMTQMVMNQTELHYS